uniref:Uncharacterized protein n=1 Tax=Rhizophora mucronata TaxID=61149 RepID=A0A2P2KF20_RHIMU
MPGLTCHVSNKEFKEDAEQKLHYKSDWHTAITSNARNIRLLMCQE